MAMEIMLGIPAIANLIREGKTHQMATIIQGGASMGMQTLDQHLKNLTQSGRVTFDEAISKAKSPRARPRQTLAPASWMWTAASEVARRLT